MFEKFPRYTEYDPKVPVWCLTPETPGCLHRFFDTPPVSPSGRYLAVFQFPFEDRVPGPGDTGTIRVIDLATGENRTVADTRGWETQMGANINWGGTDRELYFNDVDTQTWRPFAWKLDPGTGEKTKMEGTVYHASPDGTWLISANMTSMRRTQPGYGVIVPDEKVRRNRGLADDDGFYLTDTSTGKCRLLLSVKDAFEKADPPVDRAYLDDPDAFDVYGFHTKFNCQSDRLMLSLRWYPAEEEPQFNLFKSAPKTVRYAWVTCDLQGRDLHCAVGPEEWVKGGHHATWFPDGKRISMNLNIDRDVIRFVQVNYDGTNLKKMIDHVPGSGHPLVHRDGNFLVADTYTKEKNTSFGDGTIPLRWVNLHTGDETCLVRINTAQPVPEAPLRVDPHPVFDRSWRYVIFNGFVGGTRRVFAADIRDVL